MDWGAEAEAHARDVRGGVAHIEVDKSCTSEHGALLIVTTLEGSREEVELSAYGCKRLNAPDAHPDATFGCVHSLLLNTSAGYKQHFNSSLKAKLAVLVAEQDAQSQS